jgi:signal transduction histidine kinase
MAGLNLSGKLVERIYWLIKLRWIAVVGVSLATFFTANFLNIPIPAVPLYSIAVLLGAYNLLFRIYLNRINKLSPANLPLINNHIANAQISLDLASLATLIHFSGGIENPFIFYFIFHMIIASILLSRRASFLQATFAVSLLLSMTTLEYFGILPHYYLQKFMPYTLYNNYLYVFGTSFVFTSTLYIAVYMATSISSRLRERERSLQEANRLLNEKDRVKSEYVLRVTHDIKEDLAAIESCIDPVSEAITRPLNNKQTDLLQRAKQRTQRLIFFIRALLEITRIKLTRGLKLEEFFLPAVVQGLSDNIKIRAKAKKISYTVRVEPSIGKITGVRVYIEEAIFNLLANSLKYTPEGGRVRLEIKDKKQSVLIKIDDSGIGIPENELPHIFEEFYRAANARRMERQGTGLGLAIVKQIIEMHKGKTWVESEEGRGATFFIELPKQPRII